MQTIIVDTTPGFRMPTINYSQGDIGRTFAIDLRSRFGDSLPASPTITIQATKPSGLGFSVASTSISGAVVTFTVTETMSNEAGRFPAELKIVKSGTTLFTANFYIECEASAHPEGTTDGDLDSISPKFMSVTTTTLPAGDSATYSYDPETNTATFGIPKGADGSLASQVLAADYSSSKTYAVGDYVYYNGNLYRCSTAITTAEAWTSGHWTQVALGDDVSDLKSELNKSVIDYLYDSNSDQEDRYYKNDGTLGTSDVWNATQLYYLADGYTYYYDGLNNFGTAPVHCYFDSSKNFVSAITPQSGRQVLSIPANAKYIGFSIKDDDLATFEFNGIVDANELYDKASALDDIDVMELISLNLEQGTIRTSNVGQVIVFDTASNRVRTKEPTDFSGSSATVLSSGYEGRYILTDDNNLFISASPWGQTPSWTDLSATRAYIIIRKSGGADITPSEAFEAIISTDLFIQKPKHLAEQEEVDQISNDVSNSNQKRWQNIIEPNADNSAWTWWSYPQVEVESYVRNKAYFGEVSTTGVSGIGAVSMDDTSIKTKTNLFKSGVDDHNGMAIFKNRAGTPSKRFIAFGNTHNEDNFIRVYLGAADDCGDLYLDPVKIEFPDLVTYAQVFDTNPEAESYLNHQIFLATRLNITEWWGVFSNTHWGQAWGTPQPIVIADRQYYVLFRETTTNGFLRMVMYSNPNLPRTDTRIRMGFLDLSNGNIYNADGVTLLGSMSNGGVDYTDFDIIIDIADYDESQVADAEDEPRQRLLDVAISAVSDTYICYATFTGIEDAEYHVYYNGTDIDVTACGEPFYYPSVYVGGMIFIPKNPNVIYLSRKIDSRSRIEKWVYSSGSYTLDSEIDRGNSHMIQVIRPIIDKDGTILIYQKGSNNVGNFTQFNYDAKVHKINA